MMSEHLAIGLFVLKGAELVCALAALVLVVVAPEYLFWAVALFGVLVAISAAIMVTDGIANDRLLLRSGVLVRADRPVRFWALIAVHALILIAGLLLTQLGRL